MFENCDIKYDSKKEEITIVISTKVPGRPSATGKTLVLASTLGNQPIPGRPEIVLGLNCYTKR
jgi:hypothetical protein